MGPFLVRRLLVVVPLLIGITFVSFIVISLAPGGPLDFLEGESPDLSPEVKKQLTELYGLDKPLVVQYWSWLTRLARLDFGRSFLPDGKPVLTKIGERLPVTLLLNIVEMLIILAVAVPIGVMSAVRQGSNFDKVTTMFVFIGFATPDFWLALLLMSFFGAQLGWLNADRPHTSATTSLQATESVTSSANMPDGTSVRLVLRGATPTILAAEAGSSG